MVVLLIHTLKYAVVMALLALPIWIVLIRRGATAPLRRFVITGAVIAVVCGLLAIDSQRLVNQCTQASNVGCVDYGTSGIQALFVAGFVGTAWVRAYILNDR